MPKSLESAPLLPPNADGDYDDEASGGLPFRGLCFHSRKIRKAGTPRAESHIRGHRRGIIHELYDIR
jgi:hypothetical protein